MTEQKTARWPVGSLRRIAHASVLGFLQPLVPIAFWGGLGFLLFDGGFGNLAPLRPVTFVAVALVMLVAPALLVGGGLMAIARVSLADLGLRSERLGREVLLGVGCLVVYLGCFAGIIWARLPDSAATFHAVLAWSLPQRALFLMIGIAIAVFEESVFRGYLQPTLIHRLGYVGGIAVTAIVFAAWHPPLFSVTGFLVRLSLGLVTGLSRGRDRPLTAAITAHASLWAVLGLA